MYPASPGGRGRLELPAHLELTPAWRSISVELRRIVGETTYEIWLAPLKAKSWDGAVLVIEAPAATRAWVAKRFGRALERSVRTVLGDDARLAFADPVAGPGTAASGGPGAARQNGSAGGAFPGAGQREPLREPHQPL